MEITRLKLSQYRNYSSLELHPSPGLNVITGDNGQGKTNAAEAVFLCAFGRSHRTSKDAELIRQRCKGGSVKADILNATGHHTIELKLRAGERKKLLINGQQAAKSGELMGILNVVLFAPESLEIVSGGPGERRRFMDMELSQLYPYYYYRLQRYNSALKQRNSLLRSEAPLEVIEAYSAILAKEGASIVKQRSEFVDSLRNVTGIIHGELSDEKEKLAISYRPDVEYGEEELLRVFEESFSEDMRRCTTTRGPHRDDMPMTINGSDLRAFGSQGQKRTAALSLKLSEMELVEGVKGEPPVLILDDVLSELDGSRQRMLIKSISRCQCFLTCTALEGLEGIGVKKMKVFRCESGAFTEV